MEKRKKIRCRHCGTFFYPNPRNIKNQRYCSESDCRKASKITSQRRWARKNRTYFRDKANVARVQAWREEHPGYSKSRLKILEKASTGPLQDSSISPLQDLIIDKTVKNQSVNEHFTSQTLRDLISSQPLVLIGLIAKLTGFTLQDSIDSYTRNLIILANDILSLSVTKQTGGQYDAKTSALPGKSPPGTGTI